MRTNKGRMVAVVVMMLACACSADAARDDGITAGAVSSPPKEAVARAWLPPPVHDPAFPVLPMGGAPCDASHPWVVLDGNSLIAPEPIGYSNVVPFLLAMLGREVCIESWAYPGQSMSTMALNGAFRADHMVALAPRGAVRFWFAWEGTNDLAVNAKDGAAASVERAVSYARAVRSRGYPIVFATMTPANPAVSETLRLEYNAILRTRASEFDALIDIGADPVIGAMGSNVLPYYGDPVHFTKDVGHRYVAELLYPAFRERL